MLVPMDLAVLANRNSCLTPELALGWRIGQHVKEFFTDLDQVRIAVSGYPQLVPAMRKIAVCPAPGVVTVPQAARPWDLFFFHQPTGTSLKVVVLRSPMLLSPRGRLLEKELARDSDPRLRALYQVELDGLIASILIGPVEDFCLLQTERCRLLSRDVGKMPARCPWCWAQAPKAMLEVEGRRCCPQCSGLEPEWWLLREN